jgi:hypothetical protein
MILSHKQLEDIAEYLYSNLSSFYDYASYDTLSEHTHHVRKYHVIFPLRIRTGIYKLVNRNFDEFSFDEVSYINYQIICHIQMREEALQFGKPSMD